MIGIATADLSGFDFDDEDLPFLAAALARAGLTGEFLRWDDPDVDWSGCDLVVLRSTWNYPQNLPAFLAWLDRLAKLDVPLLNGAPIVRWNCDKRYLCDLADAGVPVVATGYATDVAGWSAALGAVTSSELVVKPTVSAGSDLTGRFARDDPAARALAERIWAAGKVAMVQPYLESVGRDGELAVLHLGGEFSHAVRKGPILDVGGGLLGGSYTEVVVPARPDPVQLAVAEAVLAAVPGLVGEAGPLLYSRVDLVADADGAPVLLELELIEPSLFFYELGGGVDAGAGADAADRLAAAIVRHLHPHRPR